MAVVAFLAISTLINAMQQTIHDKKIVKTHPFITNTTPL